jgi:hypothetical protein
VLTRGLISLAVSFAAFLSTIHSSNSLLAYFW